MDTETWVLEDEGYGFGEGGRPMNVGDAERFASAACGTALVLLGASRRSVGGVLAAFAGGALLWRGVTGRSRVYERVGVLGDGEDRARVHVRHSVTINRPADRIYAYWHGIEDLHRFMGALREAQRGTVGNRSDAYGPFGEGVETITEHRENEQLSWQAREGDIDHRGTLTLRPAPAAGGTIVTVEVTYHPRGGGAGAALATLMGRSPHGRLREGLRRFKALMETGTVVTTVGQPVGTCAGTRA